MSSGGTLRWKMLALMLAGTVVIYVDRNVLGILAPILKKELNFTTEQYSYVVSSFQIVYSLSSMIYALMGDVVETAEVAIATGVAGMFGYLGGALFTLTVGALAATIGYEPLFALLFLFDIVAALVLWIAIGARRSAAIAQPA